MQGGFHCALEWRQPVRRPASPQPGAPQENQIHQERAQQNEQVSKVYGYAGDSGGGCKGGGDDDEGGDDGCDLESERDGGEDTRRWEHRQRVLLPVLVFDEWACQCQASLIVTRGRSTGSLSLMLNETQESRAVVWALGYYRWQPSRLPCVPTGCWGAKHC